MMVARSAAAMEENFWCSAYRVIIVAVCFLAWPAHASDGPTHLKGHGGPIKAIAADLATQRVLTGSFDYAMMLWKLNGNGSAKLLYRFSDHDGAVSAVSFHPKDTNIAIAASDDGTISIWNLNTRTRIQHLKGHSAKILGVDISADGRWLASASWDRTLRLWDLETGRHVHTFKGHKGPVNAVRFSHDGTYLISAAYDGTLSKWRISSRELVRVAYRHGWGINVLERLPEPNLFAFGGLDGTVAVIDIDNGLIQTPIKKHDKPILALAHIARPGLLASAGGGGRIKVYRTGDWRLLEEHNNTFGPVWALAFADRGARIYYGGLDDYATAWQINPRKPFEPANSKFPRRFQVRSSDISLGQREFARKCSICHTLSPSDANRAGPTLYGVFGRRIASLPGYPYSQALKSMNIVWNAETIEKLFELGPHNFTPGSKMPLQRITDTKKRKALVSYLKGATVPVKIQSQSSKSQ